MDDLAAWLRAFLDQSIPVVLVCVRDARGSTPRDAGAAMLVADSFIEGTIGGGSLEWRAIAKAREMLAQGQAEYTLVMPLGPSIGQCCGGKVVLTLRCADAEAVAALEAVEADLKARYRAVSIFGAGHVGKALAWALDPLPLDVTIIDSRRDALMGLPARAAALPSDDPVAEVGSAPAGAALVVLTHSHALDFDIAEAALKRGDAAYIGLIGSAAKRVRFAKRFLSRGGAATQLADLVCPIGGAAVRDKRPAVIAAMAAAEIARHLFATSEPRRQIADGSLSLLAGDA